MLRGQRFGRDRRGASEVIGSVLVFAILIAAIGLYQVTVVPQTNGEVEFKHSNEVRGEMQDVRSALLRAGGSGTPGSTTVQTGVTYPSRSLTVNPGEPQGTLRTTAPAGAVNLTDVTVNDPEAGDFWNGTHNFTSRSLVYRPDYNYYADAPTIVYEPTVLYSSFPSGGEIVEGQGSIIDGRSLNVVLLSGETSGSVTRATVEAKPVSASTRTVRIEDPGHLVVKTRLSQSTWQELLAGEPASLHPSSDFTGGSPNTAVVALDPGTWTLNVANVSVGGSATEPDPAYVEVVGSTDRTLDPGATTDVTLRVLDRYGNPVEGATVNRDFGAARATGEDGTVTFEYSLGASGSATSLRMWIGSGTAEAEKATVTVSTSTPATGDPDASLINPGNGLVFQQSTHSSNTYTLEFENRNSASGAWVNVSEVRVNYYHTSPPGSGPSLPDPPEEWETNVTGARNEIAGPFETTDGSFDIAPGEHGGLEMSFYQSSGSYSVDSGDYFILSLVFEDGSSRVYFVASQD